MLSWCFEAVSGRGLLKDLNLHLSWERKKPQLGLNREALTTSGEDQAIIACLDSCLKEYPPAHELGTDEIRFQYSIKRRR